MYPSLNFAGPLALDALIRCRDMSVMCSRFTLTAAPREVEALFALLDLEDFPPRYNIAPTQPVLLVTAGPRRARGSNLPERAAMLVRWGFIPGWVKNPRKTPLLINARAESAIDKPAFRAAMRHRRALIPATGFYEWRRDGSARQAFFIRPKGGGIIAFAALLETWCEPGGSEIDTAAILTTAAAGEVARIHDRMPAVIRPEEFARWLDCRTQEPAAVADLLEPADAGLFEVIAVSDKVNKVTNTGADIQEPVAVRAVTAPRSTGLPEQMTLF
jgi:putative SOS response-associated peptidase YedK